jgi:hypothetical protein
VRARILLALLVPVPAATLWACSVGSLELAGRACPCVDGYTCVNGACVPAGSELPDASTDGAAGADSGSDAGDASTLLFDDEFDQGALDPIWIVGSGNWSLVNGEATNENTVEGEFMLVQGFQDETSYEAVARLRMVGSPPTGDNAMEIAVRVSDTPPYDRLQCSFETGDWYLRYLLPNTGLGSFDDLPLSPPANADPMAYYTLHTVVTGQSVHCWVDEVPGSDDYTTLSPAQVPSGSFGLATYQHRVAFDWLRVYSVP